MIPRSLDTHDEWIGFLEELRKLEAYSMKRSSLLIQDLNQEIDLGRKKIANYKNEEIFFSPTKIISIVAVIFLGLLKKDLATSAGLLGLLLLLLKYINKITAQKNTVTQQEGEKKIL